MRAVTQDDCNAAARGLNMIAMSPAELADLMREFRFDTTWFAERVIHLAAKQMRAVKLFNGARDD